MINMDVGTNDTLPDDAWKDSFDKLLDQRPILRELNLIKRDVRVSFNMNSSYENSSCNNSESTNLNVEAQPCQNTKDCKKIDVPNNIESNNRNKKLIKPHVISTPLKNNDNTNPFKCTLSPIGTWDLQHFKTIVKKDCKKKTRVELNATPIFENNVESKEDLYSHSIEKNNYPRYTLGLSPLELVQKKWKSKQSQKRVDVAFNDLDESREKSAKDSNQVAEIMTFHLRSKFEIQPGKWRKSLNSIRRTRHPVTASGTNLKTFEKGRSTVGTDNFKSSSSSFCVAGNRKSICIRPNSNKTRSVARSTYSQEGNDFKRQILQRCGQRNIITFDKAYNEEYLQNCCKIGEGAFGEVFVYSENKAPLADCENSAKTVLKIIPIEGKQLVNGEVQKSFEQILPEIIISMELCGLSDDSRNTNITSGFVNIQRVRCVKGRYPLYLKKLWEEYDLEKKSENDHPKCFTNNQQYIVLELGYGGQDLEGFNFKNAEQSYYALQQIILTLAVGEKEFQFEHRDLHWGNVLVNKTEQLYKSYKLNDNILTVPTKGIQITIIDYTLSRMTFNDYCFYNDLSNDEELFNAAGDYQFEIYRMMRKALNNKWETFEPKTNIFWISYIISKLIEGVIYKNTRSKIHLQYLDKLRNIQTSILSYNNCVDCANDLLLT